MSNIPLTDLRMVTYLDKYVVYSDGRIRHKSKDTFLKVSTTRKGYKTLKIYYDGITIFGLLKNENFNFIEFLSKLKLQPTALQKCATQEQYKILIEEVYNYRRREKVNLRF